MRCLSPTPPAATLLGVLFSFAALLGCAGETKAQTTVSGTVREEGTDRGIGAAEIRLLDSNGRAEAGAVTDSLGAFSLETEVGSYQVVVERLGYATVESEPLEIGEDEDLQIDVMMSPAAVPIDAITVTVRRNEPARIVEHRLRAEENQRLGRGRIYMRADIERLRPASAETLLAGFPWGGRCQPQILVDGLPPVESLGGIRPDDLEGVELYRGVSQIPPEYYRYGMCGLALIWLRTDPPGSQPLSWGRIIAAGLVLTLLALVSR
jgi:Carboxypeptidase regulatory-like domain